MYCTNCNKEIYNASNYCTTCGNKLIKKKQNSKFGIVFTVISNISFLLCFIYGFACIFDIEIPSQITKESFIEYIEEKGCSYIDVQERNNYYGVDTYIVTNSASCPYLISYTTFNEEKRSNEFLNEIIKEVAHENKNITGRTSININNKYYELSTTGDFYKRVTFTDQSILYASVSKEYRQETMEMFKDLGYYYEINWNSFSILWCSFFIVLIIFIVSMWGIEKKIRSKGWIALIPFYNIACLSKDILGSNWYVLLLFIPLVNIIFILRLLYRLVESFGKSISTYILLLIFPTIFLPLLAFDTSKFYKS